MTIWAFIFFVALTDCGTDILSHFPIPLSSKLNVHCPALLLACPGHLKSVWKWILMTTVTFSCNYGNAAKSSLYSMLLKPQSSFEYSEVEELFENVTKKGPMCCFGISWWHISLVIDWISVVSLGGFYGINPFAVNINVNRCYHAPAPPPTSINPKTQRVCTWFS